MKTPLTCYCYQISLLKTLEDILTLFCLRIGLFLFSTTFRYFGSAMGIAALLLLVGISGEPVDSSCSPWQIGLVLGPRLLSILLSLVWMSVGLCRLSMQWMRADTWRQEMLSNEASLRYRISILEDWLVFPVSKMGKVDDRVVEVRYR